MEPAGHSKRMTRHAALCNLQPELLDHLQKLPLHILPFAQAEEREEIVAAEFAELSRAQLVFASSRDLQLPEPLIATTALTR